MGMISMRVKESNEESTIDKLDEKVYCVNEEEMKMKSENDKHIKNFDLCEKVEVDELLSQQEAAVETIWKVEEATSLQKKHHLSSTEASKEILQSMEMKLSAREKELNDIKVKCVQNEEKLNESEKKIREMEDKIKVINTTRKKSNEMEYVSQQAAVIEKIQKLEEAMLLQQEQHLS